MAQPDNITNGAFLDATLVQAWFDYLVSLAEQAAAFARVPQLEVAPDPAQYNFYYDTTLSVYRLYTLEDDAWHAILLS